MEVSTTKREQNKASKKTILISAARRLFEKNGFELTSIDGVAREAGLTKRTLYQYFASKEDLFYAVILPGARRLMATYKEAMAQGNTAREKIYLGNNAYLKFYRDDLPMFRLMNYRPANRQNTEASPYYQELMEMGQGRLSYFIELVNEAKADGSINPQMDMQMAVFFAFYSAFSLLYTVSMMNSWDMIEMDEQRFLQFSLDLFSDSLKPEKTVKKNKTHKT